MDSKSLIAQEPTTETDFEWNATYPKDRTAGQFAYLARRNEQRLRVAVRLLERVYAIAPTGDGDVWDRDGDEMGPSVLVEDIRALLPALRGEA